MENITFIQSTQPAPFNKDLITELISETKDWREPALIENGFDKSFFSEEDVLVILRMMAEAARADVNLRVYIDHGLRHDYEFSVLQNPPHETESLSAWTHRIFGNRKFCVALNNAEKFNDDLTQRAAFLCRDFLNGKEIPTGGIDMGIFMGNYGYTPFGIHHDGNGISILHCHLGPNDKEFWMWDNDWYRDYTGSTDPCFEPEALFPFAQKYTFKPYSIFFMPEKYHIGYNDDFSVDLTFGLNNISAEMQLEKALAQSGKYLIRKKNLAGSTIHPEDILREDFISAAFAGSTTEDYVKESLDDFKLSLQSNAGFEFPPCPDSSEINKDDLYGRKIKRKNPFPIMIKNRENRFLIIFARRNRILVKYNLTVTRLVDMLNTGAEFIVKDFIASLNGNLSGDAILGLLKIFAALRAITIE
jgi:hypothetical protein